MSNSHLQLLIANGIDPKEAALIDEAIRLGRRRFRMAALDIPALRSVRRSLFSGSQTRGKDFRAYHSLVNSELKRLSPEEIAFGDIPDWVREQHSAFCFSMFKGHQLRYLDRHEDETVHEYLDRPNKTSLNVTRVVINVLSKLYHQPPSRDFEFAAEEVGAGSPEVQERLEAIWSNKHFNKAMKEADKLTRLVGTVAIRPLYDPKVKGKIRLWVYKSHQLRVIPQPTRPWEPAAVIERIQPFGKRPGMVMNVWTDKHFVSLEGRKVEVVEHQFGRLPHVFVREEESFESFFVEGRGRVLCDPNAVLNNDLSDLEEIKQMQGFAVCEVINPVEDDIRVSPRNGFVFRPANREIPFGVNFKTPGAPIGELRSDIDAGIRRIFMVNGVPVVAVFGGSLDERQISGEAIRTAMQPVVDELKERENVFLPVEWDLADSMMRVVSFHEPDFTYQRPVQVENDEGETVTVFEVPDELVPRFTVKYQPLTFPKSTRDQVTQDDFSIAQGKETPAQQMRRDNPEDFATHDDAVKQWKTNLAETQEAGFSTTDTEIVQASYGPPEGNGKDSSDTEILDAMLGGRVSDFANE